MRLQEIVNILREYFFLALAAVIIIGIVFLTAYFLLYRRLLKGKKRLPKKQMLVGGMFIGYFMMVLGVTFLNRGPNFQGGMDLTLFSTYRQAWYSFSVRHWQFVILNIVMFVPFGILLPLVHTRFQKAVWTIGAALFFTLSIESFQLMSSLGNFVVDDLFNNTLGAVIGYGVVMGILKISTKQFTRSLVYLSPLLLTVGLFSSMFTYYHLKEFGNLPLVPIQRVDVGTVSADVPFDEKRPAVPIYKAPTYTKAEAYEFVLDFFEKMNVDTSEMEIISYQDEGVYTIRGGASRSIWLYYLGGGYRYTDFSSFHEGVEPKDVEEERLLDFLDQINLHIPSADFQKIETGTYEWTVNKLVIGNEMIDGNLVVRYYGDDTLKEMDNKLITYKKVRDVQIKSEQEAYEKLINGKFLHNTENNRVETLQIHHVELSYQLDTKGYYQPVYEFHSTLDGTEMTISIPGL